MIKKVLFIGATGMLGRPVAEVLSNSGYEVTAFVRNPQLARNIFGSGSKVLLLKGDLHDTPKLIQAMRGRDAVYISLSVRPEDKKEGFHTEGKGLENILTAAKETKLQRIAFLSSLIRNYETDWWVLQLKREAVRMIKESGVDYTLYFPSIFMEAIPNQFRQGKKLMLAGQPKYPLNWISARDFGKQVAASLKPIGKNKEYIIQGPEAIKTEDAFKRFISAYKKDNLRISKASIGMLKFMGIFSRKYNYSYHIVDALNNYEERFQANETWAELGKPETTLEDFAASLGVR